MNTNEIKEAIHAKLSEKRPELSKKVVQEVITEMVEMVTNGIASGETVNIAHLGVFKQSPRKARNGRNPKTGEPLHIPAKNVVKFTAARALKEEVK